MKRIISFLVLFLSVLSNVQAEEIKRITVGNKDAKITIIAFESLTCSHCANFHKNVYPQLKEEYIDTGLAKIEFRHFPLDMAAFNASKIAHCKNDGKSEILHYLFENQDKWIKGNTIADLNKNLKNFIDSSNFSLNFEECINNTKIEDYILEDRINGAKKFKIQATPTLIINGEKFESNSSYKKIKKYLEKLI